MPTGAGKTACAVELARRARGKGKSILFVVERIVLAKQAKAHFETLGAKVGLLQGENSDTSADDDVLVATIQTLRSRISTQHYDLILVDECHLLHKAHEELIKTQDAHVIGLSATPMRKGLGSIFENLVRGPSIGRLIADGYLVPARAWGATTDDVAVALKGIGITAGDYVASDLGQAMRKRVLIDDIVSTWKRLADGRPTLCFCVDIAHSKMVSEQFASEGIACEHIDAFSSAEERTDIFDRFRRKVTKVLTSVNVLSIGFDMPLAEVAILARPTASLALHIQQVGRVLRPSPGKREALLLDHSANIARHGMPADFEVPDLTRGSIIRSAAEIKKERPKMVPCKGCGLMLHFSERVCPSCGARRAPLVMVWNADGRLVPLQPEQPRRSPAEPAVLSLETQYRNLLWVEKNARTKAGKPYKRGYAWVRFTQMHGPNSVQKSWNALGPLQPSGEVFRSLDAAWRRDMMRRIQDQKAADRQLKLGLRVKRRR